MAATVVGLTRDGREGTAARADHTLRDHITLSDTYWIATTAGTDGADSVLLAAGLPRLSDIHPRVPSLQVTGYATEEVQGRTDRWKVKVNYETIPIDDTDVDIDFEIHRLPIAGGHAFQVLAGGSTGYNYEGSDYGSGGAGGGGIGNPWVLNQNWGRGINNSAGEPFVPVLEDDEAYIVVRVSRNEFVTDLNAFKGYTNSVNAQPFMGGPPRTWLMSVRARPILHSAIKQWRVEYLLKYNKLTWDIRVLDQGRYYRSIPGRPPGGIRIEFLDDNQDNIVQPLDGQGGALAPGLPPNFIRFNHKQVVDWNPLSLDIEIFKFFSAPVPPAPPMFPPLVP